MSETKSENAVAEQLFAVLIALQKDTLLLPNVAVAEAASAASVRPASDMPRWFAGWLPLRDSFLPVVRFEGFAEEQVDVPGRRAHVLVLNALTRSLEDRRFGLICEGYPHLVTLGRLAVRPTVPRPTDTQGCVLSRVRVASVEAAIPDLPRIEAELAAALAANPAARASLAAPAAAG